MTTILGRPALGQVLLGDTSTTAPGSWPIRPADAADLLAYRALRRTVFVDEQGLFDRHDHDHLDDDPRTLVLVARSPAGEVLGGVRVAPATESDLGWWTGSRLVVAPNARRRGGIGPTLVHAACAHAERLGALRFEATVQEPNRELFVRLGWQTVRTITVQRRAHVLMRWPIGRIASLASSTKAALGPLLSGLRTSGSGLGRTGFVGDDGAPVPGTDVVATCDAIVPSLVERDPEWAGWCGVLVNLNDLAAMGAAPIGLLDAIGARDASFAARVVAGLRAASQRYGVPVLGGHTQFGVGAALSVTALGRTHDPVPGGGGRVGHAVRLTADLGGGWRQGHSGRQWDSSTVRTREELTAMTSFVARTRPAAAKDVSMAGVVGTLGMLAEASGCGAELEVSAVARPASAGMADWLTCFPGFGMITTDRPGRAVDAGPAVSSECGRLVPGSGVALRWPDGECLPAIDRPVTGLGPALAAPELT